MYLMDGIVLVKNNKENKSFLYDKNNRIKYSINQDMFELLDYINENKAMKLEDIISNYDGVEEALDFLLSKKLITEEIQFEKYKTKVITDTNSARLFIECTDCCNLSCPHCYGSFSCNNSNYLQIEVIENLIKMSAKLGTYEVDLTGGEPLLHPNLGELFFILYKYGMLTRLFTNLTLCTDYHISLMKKYGIKTIITSLESHDKYVHDKFRGLDGAFASTVNNIKKLKTNGIDVEVNLVLGSHNIKNFDISVQYILSLGVFCFIDVTTLEGRAKNITFNFPLAAKVLKKYYLNAYIKKCGVFNRMLYISSNGNIYPCPSIRIAKFIYGNIYGKYNLKQCFQRTFAELKDWDCHKNCNITECTGGCRARALKRYGTVRAQDDYYCKIFKLNYITD